MKIFDFLAETINNLKGKIGKSILILLAFELISIFMVVIQYLLPTNLFIISISAILIILFQTPIMFGLSCTIYKLFNQDSKNVDISDFLTIGLKNFKKAWGIALYTFLRLIPPISLLITAGIILSLKELYNNLPIHDFLMFIVFVLSITSIIWIIIKTYLYSITNFIAFDNLKLPSKEIVKKSKELMLKKRSKLFLIHLIFIALSILITYSLTAISAILALFIYNTLITILTTVILLVSYLILFICTQFSTIVYYKYLINEYPRIVKDAFKE